MFERVQFGVYELDPEALELRKHGLPVRLQDQPLRVLVALLERPGEIVTREQLRERIWGKDTFVDFDQSLNKAVNRLREALNDDPAQPRYLETVPRRGYRFVAPVTSSPIQGERGVPHSREQVPLSNTLARRSTSSLIAIGSAIGILTIAAWLLWSRRSPVPTLQEPRRTSTSSFYPALSPDGRLLAYASAPDGGTPHIWIQQASGGEATQLTSGPEFDIAPDFSPDGSQIAFYSERNGGGIYVVPSLSGEVKLVVAGDNLFAPHFSPSGGQIVYSTDNGIFTVPVTGGESVGLPINAEFNAYGRALWSPSGKEILFYGARKEPQNQPGQWWITPLTEARPRAARIPSIENNPDLWAWTGTEKAGEWILYSTASHDTWKLWRVAMAPDGAVVEESQLLSSGAGMLGSVTASQQGKIAWNLWTINHSIYEIATNRKGDKSAPTVQLPLVQGGSQRSPSLSHDGKWMSYDSSRPDKPNSILIRDLSTGAEHLADEKGRMSADGGETSISPDGSSVLFTRDCAYHDDPNRPSVCSFLFQEEKHETGPICKDCSPRGFSPDGSMALFQNYEKEENRDNIVSIDLQTAKQRLFLADPEKPLFHPFFSWDGRWVVFKRLNTLHVRYSTAQILIAPVRHSVPGERSEWVEVTDGRYADDKPQFSPDGNTIYFTSTRDGYLCIWAQRLNPVTKRPLGQPFAYEHFHNASGRSAPVYQPWMSDLSVASDKMVINLPQVQSDVWLTDMK